MTLPQHLKFVFFSICCMQHAHACVSTCSCFCMAANSSMIAQANASTTAFPTMSTMAAVNMTASEDGTNTTGTPMSATTGASATAIVVPTHVTTKSSSADGNITNVATTSAKAVVNDTASEDETSTTGTPMTATKKASAAATVEPTSTTQDTTKSSSADVKTTSPSATTSSSMSTIRNVTFSIGTGYSSPDCASCSNGGTITVTMSCSINNDKKCDKDGFSKTSCDYVTMVDKMYSCAVVKRNFTFFEEMYLKPVKLCDKVCPANGSVTLSIGTKYSSPDCASCSNGGTITVTMSCSINKDTKCDKDEFMKTSCDYVTMVDKVYSCADVKKNFTHYVGQHLKSVKECGDVCRAYGSVLSAHLVFIFSSGLAVGLLSQTL